ncbi:hypothetical protein OY671_011434, partial [Metschnikowia pulcherrima]
VGIPDGRHPVLRNCIDFDTHVAGSIEDWARAFAPGERKEWSFHQVASIARAGIAGGDDERTELASLAGRAEAARRHGRASPLAMRAAGGARLDVARVRRRAASGSIGPGFEIANGIDDAPAEFAKGRTVAVAAILLERTRREAEEARGLGGAHVARRESRGSV